MIIVANYKMNLNIKDYKVILKSINENRVKDTELVLCPPFVYLPYFSKNKTWFKLGAQDVSANSLGAFTGQVSANMLNDFKVDYAIVGHCERRAFETELDIANKVYMLTNAGIIPIICVGEDTADEDDSMLIERIKKVLTKIKPTAKFYLAYEPVWSITSGRPATNSYINKKVETIKKELKSLGFVAPVLYGGGIDNNNYKKIKHCNIDGILVGALALDEENFLEFLRGL